ncbi:alphaK I23 [Puccinia graminis f. sp. tritici CRL 75-36-700-3]|uniref:AlphaK I23 n=1 Tax=Puccinia graminis f. sp. tritici (strain CRL 75-36-700-3 / race SCCL) TaxID=418459 RepID=E3JRI5_PUCGT|nr:alphaK I23 [Puccinia graminis f. sp. tritici CRL 75-36-700-3]EFP74614.2 alphaK I23 [Puccinia graminis f. sp. tritici CRL 75-36-700-3]
MGDMLKCLKCNRWSTEKHFDNHCLECIVSHIKTGPSQANQSSPSGPSAPHTQILPSRIHTAGPAYSAAPRRVSTPHDTGTHVFYRGIAKELRGVKKREASATKSSRASTSRTPDPKQSPEKRFVKAGVTVYIDDQPQKKTGIIPKVLEVDTKKPNFYEDFRHHLWTLFSEEILAKTEITFPPDPEQYTCLGTLNSKIENHGTLLDLARTGKTIKSAAVINLFYQHPIEAFPDTVLPTETRTNRKRKYNADPPKTSKSATWALGGKIATKPVRGPAGLSAQVDTLSHPVTQRLHFYTIEEQPPPEANQKSYVINDYIHAVTFPFDIKVDRKKHVGEGSSCQSYPAQVRSSENGQEVINKWVAKIRYSDPQPNVSNHASDAITYRGFGLILAEFKDLISEKLDGLLKIKGSQIEGFGPILTDPQVVDLNANAWAEGNSAGTGIDAFLNEHVCSTVCNILNLGQGGKAVDLKWKRPTPRQPLAFDRILASKNRGVFSGSEASDDSDLPEILS